jgi:hypothetical protein
LPDKIAGQRLRQVERLNSGDLLIDLSACGASASGSFRPANFDQMINGKLDFQTFSLTPNQELLVSTA